MASEVNKIDSILRYNYIGNVNYLLLDRHSRVQVFPFFYLSSSLKFPNLSNP